MPSEQEVQVTWLDEQQALWACPACRFHQKSSRGREIVRVAPLNHGENYFASRCMNCNIRVRLAV